MSLLKRRTGLAFVLSRVAPTTLVGIVGLVASGAGCSSVPPDAPPPPPEPELASQGQAMGGDEGMLEYSLDAPWRMEPRSVKGRAIYGQIPLQMTIDDADQIADDIDGFSAPTIAQVCELDVTEGAVTTVIPITKFTEIERTRGHWTYPGTEQPSGPPRDACTATSTTDCSPLRSVAGTSEWHALAMYTPQHFGPGIDVPLTLQLKVMRGSQPCTDTDLTHTYRMINHVRVHYGEAPLPKFSTSWAYGDLHYHSQGTDNEGESGYNYRGVSRAMESVGLDFLWVTDHASASDQIIDADASLDLHLLSLRSAQIEAYVKRGVLRDMDARRFRTLSGVVADTNKQTALRANASPLTTRTPQIFLGGEIDVIPEIKGAPSSYTYGDDVSYTIDSSLCGGWHRNAQMASNIDCDDGVFRCADVSIIGSILGDNISSCDYGELWQQTTNGEYLLRDVQALNEYDFGREHMVYLPDPSAKDPFVASQTGVYGGAERRLVEDRSDGTTTYKGMLPEIEGKHGSVFLAHHLNAGVGSEGPNGPPWTASMLDKAWRSSAVLGLEFWNEDGRRKTTIGPNGHIEDGYNRDIDHDITLADSIRYALKPASNGKFELVPFDLTDGKFDQALHEVDERLTNGSVSWDRLNMKGLDPAQTKAIAWLPAGQPRKMFMAGGSDAHGDFNYQRNGYMIGTDTIIDSAIGTPRNLVNVGAPTVSIDPKAPAVIGPAQALTALRAGHFSITDGPAVRIAIDTNANGVIDETDTPMGDTVSIGLHTSQIPVLVEWASTAEFGEVESIELTVGVLDSATSVARLYAGGMGPAVWMFPKITDSYLSSDGQVQYSHGANDYWFLDNPNPPIDWSPGEFSTMLGTQLAGVPADVAGVRPYTLDLTRLTVDKAGTMGDRIFVRAVALGRRSGSPADCANVVTDGARLGRCTRRFGYSNPIWLQRSSKGVIVPIPVPPLPIGGAK